MNRTTRPILAALQAGTRRRNAKVQTHLTLTKSLGHSILLHLPGIRLVVMAMVLIVAMMMCAEGNILTVVSDAITV